MKASVCPKCQNTVGMLTSYRYHGREVARVCEACHTELGGRFDRLINAEVDKIRNEVSEAWLHSIGPLRPLVMTFARAMELQFRKNDHKSGEWDGIHQLRAKLFEEVLELLQLIDRGDHFNSHAIIHEAADVGNVAAMICGYVNKSWPHVNERS